MRRRGENLAELGVRTVAVSSPLAGLVAPVPVGSIVFQAPAGEEDAASCVEEAWHAHR